MVLVVLQENQVLLVLVVLLALLDFLDFLDFLERVETLVKQDLLVSVVLQDLVD